MFFKHTQIVEALEELGYRNVNDGLNQWLREATGLSGSTNHLWYVYLGSLGYTGSLNDRLAAYYEANPDTPFGINIRNLLFSSSEKGVWYDPSDLTSMFQDNAGTTAAVAGQPVGLVLDKSQGLVLGPELVVNGTFDNADGWSVGLGWSITGGVAQHDGLTGGSILSRAVGAELGKTYKVTATVIGEVAASASVQFKIGASGNVAALTAAGTYEFYLTSAGSNPGVLYATASNTVKFGAAVDNVSAKELPGYHATQSTSTARGVLGTSLIDLDGVDDAYTVATGGGGSTGFFLCAAVRVDGGAGANRVIYSDAGTNTGYILRLNTSNQLELAAGNGTAYTLAATTDTLTAGPYVVTAWDDGTNLNVQVNSGTAGTAARPVVSAGNADFRIGKDYGAATGYFNGAIYPLIYVKNGENVDANDRTAVKTYVASKAGVTL